MQNIGEDIHFANFSSIFDQNYPDIPLGEIFIDQCHLPDNANKIIAQEILTLLNLEK